jgi:maleate isomerase
MRPPSITNHVRGFRIPNAPTRTDAEFTQRLANMRTTMVDAMDKVLTLDPTTLSSLPRPTLRTGRLALGSCERLLAKSSGRVGVTLGAHAILAALDGYGGAHPHLRGVLFD